MPLPVLYVGNCNHLFRQSQCPPISHKMHFAGNCPFSLALALSFSFHGAPSCLVEGNCSSFKHCKDHMNTSKILLFVSYSKRNLAWKTVKRTKEFPWRHVWWAQAYSLLETPSSLSRLAQGHHLHGSQVACSTHSPDHSWAGLLPAPNCKAFATFEPFAGWLLAKTPESCM